jgi:hypothetical protein
MFFSDLIPFKRMWSISHPSDISYSELSLFKIWMNMLVGSSRIRCIIATGTLEMGLDIRDVQLVVHIFCSKYILSYWHEAGRCAKDGTHGFSLILFDCLPLNPIKTSFSPNIILQSASEAIFIHRTLSFIKMNVHHTCTSLGIYILKHILNNINKQNTGRCVGKMFLLDLL